MNIEEINKVFDDVDAKMAKMKKSSGIHHKSHDICNIFDVKDEYINKEYESWKTAMEILRAEDKLAILTAIFSKIFMGEWDKTDALTPNQKVFYHAGIRLFVMKGQNEENRNNQCGYNFGKVK